MKKIMFLGNSLENLQEFTPLARRRAGFSLQRLQMGQMPDDYKPMKAIGKGVEEIRVHDEHGIYRVIYIARLQNTVYVLHAFQKKTQKTAQADIELAKKRFRQLLGDLKS